ncbi:uncharacterized protein METZ01_LOCUS150919, partial [marine metagenome]
RDSIFAIVEIYVSLKSNSLNKKDTI